MKDDSPHTKKTDLGLPEHVGKEQALRPGVEVVYSASDADARYQELLRDLRAWGGDMERASLKAQAEISAVGGDSLPSRLMLTLEDVARALDALDPNDEVATRAIHQLVGSDLQVRLTPEHTALLRSKYLEFNLAVQGKAKKFDTLYKLAMAAKAAKDR